MLKEHHLQLTGGGTGGKGGYSVGTISLNKETILYIYVGGQGTTSTSASVPRWMEWRRWSI